MGGGLSDIYQLDIYVKLLAAPSSKIEIVGICRSMFRTSHHETSLGGMLIGVVSEGFGAAEEFRFVVRIGL
jgi:hypothetical protein